MAHRAAPHLQSTGRRNPIWTRPPPTANALRQHAEMSRRMQVPMPQRKDIYSIISYSAHKLDIENQQLLREAAEYRQEIDSLSAQNGELQARIEGSLRSNGELKAHTKVQADRIEVLAASHELLEAQYAAARSQVEYLGEQVSILNDVMHEAAELKSQVVALSTDKREMLQNQKWRTLALKALGASNIITRSTEGARMAYYVSDLEEAVKKAAADATILRVMLLGEGGKQEMSVSEVETLYKQQQEQRKKGGEKMSASEQNNVSKMIGAANEAIADSQHDDPSSQLVAHNHGRSVGEVDPGLMMLLMMQAAATAPANTPAEARMQLALDARNSGNMSAVPVESTTEQMDAAIAEARQVAAVANRDRDGDAAADAAEKMVRLRIQEGWSPVMATASALVKLEEGVDEEGVNEEATITIAAAVSEVLSSHPRASPMLAAVAASSLSRLVAAGAEVNVAITCAKRAVKSLSDGVSLEKVSGVVKSTAGFIREQATAQLDAVSVDVDWSLEAWLESLNLNELVLTPALTRPLREHVQSSSTAGATKSIEKSFIENISKFGSSETVMELLRESPLLHNLSEAIFEGAVTLAKVQASATSKPATLQGKQETSADDLMTKMLEESQGQTLFYTHDVSLYWEGVTRLVGEPDVSMGLSWGIEREHCRSGDSDTPFMANNYGTVTTSRIEWAFVGACASLKCPVPDRHAIDVLRTVLPLFSLPE